MGSGIRWLAWSKDAFEMAKAEDRPILLDISASWCHWCHVMDGTTFSDPGVIDIISKNFVPVRVDADKRPDINRRYSLGSLPSALFLTPRGDVITGTAFVPSNEMREALRSVAKYYAENKQAIQAKVTEIKAAREVAVETPGELSAQIVQDVISLLTASFDPVHGGFGFEPKLPHADALEFALSQYRANGDAAQLTVVTKTLDGMGDGGIYDREAGGFFRYSMTRDWSEPHFEKMCEDNAKLLSIYLHAYAATGKPSYRDKAEGIIDYVDRTLSDREDGGFYGSQCADEVYYRLSPKERGDARAPYVDRTFYASWNALMASSYIEAGFILDRPELTRYGLKATDRVFELLYAEDGLHHYYDTQVGELRGLLVDHMEMARCLMKAYQATGSRAYLERAEALVKRAVETLSGSEGGFFDIPEREDVGALTRRYKSIEENSVAAKALIGLFELTGEPRYGELAEKALQVFADTYGSFELAAAPYADSVQRFLSPRIKVLVVGAREDELRGQLVSTAFKAYQPYMTVLPLDPREDAPARFSVPREGRAAAYLYVGGSCVGSVNDPAQLRERISQLTPRTNN